MKGYKLKNKSWEYLNESKRETKDKKNEEGNKKNSIKLSCNFLVDFYFLKTQSNKQPK